jgi:hypothetical protein
VSGGPEVAAVEDGQLGQQEPLDDLGIVEVLAELAAVATIVEGGIPPEPFRFRKAESVASSRTRIPLSSCTT